MPVQERDRPTKHGFRETLIELSRSLGPHHLPLDHEASDINSFLQADSTHHSLVKRAVIDIYRANRCNHLDSTIDTAKTFDALGKIYTELDSTPETDVDQIDLLEKLGQELSALLPAIRSEELQAGATPLEGDTPGQVVSLSRATGRPRGSSPTNSQGSD